jgi:hypothetical protein
MLAVPETSSAITGKPKKFTSQGYVKNNDFFVALTSVFVPLTHTNNNLELVTGNDLEL